MTTLSTQMMKSETCFDFSKRLSSGWHSLCNTQNVFPSKTEISLLQSCIFHFSFHGWTNRQLMWQFKGFLTKWSRQCRCGRCSLLFPASHWSHICDTCSGIVGSFLTIYLFDSVCWSVYWMCSIYRNKEPHVYVGDSTKTICVRRWAYQNHLCT